MVSNELLEEIINISLKGRLMNKKLVENAFFDVFDNVDWYTKAIFQDLIFSKIKDETDIRANTYPDEGIIIFDLEKIYKDEKENYIKYNMSVLKQNLNIILTIMHEIEHLKEPYKISRNNFEGRLLRYTQIHDSKLSKSIYSWDPSEKIAFSDSSKLLLENIKQYPNFKIDFFDEYKYVNNNLIKYTKLGYYYDEFDEKYSSPLIEFLYETKKIKNINKIFKLKSIDSLKKEQMDVITRMKYGFPITQEHIKEINKQKIK